MTPRSLEWGFQNEGLLFWAPYYKHNKFCKYLLNVKLIFEKQNQNKTKVQLGFLHRYCILLILKMLVLIFDLVDWNLSSTKGPFLKGGRSVDQTPNLTNLLKIADSSQAHFYHVLHSRQTCCKQTPLLVCSYLIRVSL